ncbi:MAG: hypothetical protein WC415_00450 [Patescibacteria group bacterium]|jgi:hypothetical protein
MASENFELNQKPEVSINLIERIEKLEKIKTPEELLSFMKKNINYGFIGKDDDKVYSPRQEGWGVGKQPEARLQSPEELLKSGYGACWEQTDFEKQWFAKNNFEFKTLLLMFGKDISQKNPAHTLLAYKKDDKWHWFENTLDKYSGIYEFDDLEDLIEYAKTVLINNAFNNGATENDIKEYKLYDYDMPAYGCSTDEFIGKIKLNSRNQERKGK